MAYFGQQRRTWWQEAVVYQIYPRSFQDSNGDGVGDLGGIIRRLDYFEYLGVDVLWLCPIYRSPQVDNGYDISDYYSVDPMFGTLEQFDALLEGVHRRGMKLIMDLVVNHTSDRHPWFRQSRSSKDSPYRGYYIWKPPRRRGIRDSSGGEGGKGGNAGSGSSRSGGRLPGGESLLPPNNWASFFEGSAWQYDELTGEYYLHLFAPQQPDLNWENPALREEIYRMMRWWLDRGVDGFRMDVINLISKDPDFPDSDGNAARITGGEYFINGPKALQYLREMRERVLDRYEVMTVGEMPDVTPEQGLEYVHRDYGPLDMLFQFDHMDLDTGAEGYWSVSGWSLRELKRLLGSWQRTLDGLGWNSLFMNNHDQPRMVSRFGDDGAYRRESAKMLATMLHMLQGTPYLYQGEEIGMTNAAFDDISDYRDVATLNYYARATEEEGLSGEEAMKVIRYRSRDNARTPMQWDGSENAGFTSGTPWLPVNPNRTEVNVQREMADPDSVLNYYRRLIELRKSRPVIVYGSYEDLLPEDEALYLFRRYGAGEELFVLLNVTGRDVPVETGSLPAALGGTLLIGNYRDAPERLDGAAPAGAPGYREEKGGGGKRTGGGDKRTGGPQRPGGIVLRPYEARVYSRPLK